MLESRCRRKLVYFNALEFHVAVIQNPRCNSLSLFFLALNSSSCYNLKPFILTILLNIVGFPLRLTLVDTPGFGDYSNNTDSWIPVCEYIDEQYLNYTHLESKYDRKGLYDNNGRRNVDDTRVHAVLYFLPPTGHGYA